MTEALLRLPIDEVLPELVALVRAEGVAVLVAPPGAGKTTRVPAAILREGLTSGDIVVLQPRRIAARLAATRVADELDCELGATVGYEVRLDRNVSSETKIRFVTEGILTRRLLVDPTLRGTGCVIIDEFHERSLDCDLALALVARLRQSRPDLKLIVMSATLDAEPVAAYLGARTIRSEGRTFPLEISFADPREDATVQLGKQVSGAVRKLVRDGLDGDILVFVPGAGEIRQCLDGLADAAATHKLELVPLHGDLTWEQQEQAIRKSDTKRVIVATNIAETSVTLPAVAAVIDSGKARVMRHNPWTGLPALQVVPISKASATQRAGRAGRTKAGKVVRLYTQHDFELRKPFEQPEISRADLCETALHLRSHGLQLSSIKWFETPPTAAIDAAELLLTQLGAVDRSGTITAVGKSMLRFAIHPRLARLICEAEARGAGADGCLLAAAVSGKDLRLEQRSSRNSAKQASPSDLIDDFDAMLDARQSGMRANSLRSAGIDVATAQQVDKLARQLERSLDAKRTRSLSDLELDTALQLATLAGFPDRVAKRRTPRSPDFVFAYGGGGTLAPTSAVVDADYIVAVDSADVGQRGMASKVTIRKASQLEPDWLIELFAEQITEVEELRWNTDKERVELVSEMRYGELAINQSVSVDGARDKTDEASAIVAAQVAKRGIDKFVDSDELAELLARIKVVATATGDATLMPSQESMQALLARSCEGIVSFAELRQANLLDLIAGSLGSKQALLHRLAPTHVDLPRRKRVKVHYHADRAPSIASRMQDFFGLARSPAIADGKIALVVELLAPNQRPVQVTSDLPGFWVKHYPELRNQLARRYPRHQWPLDPTSLINEEP